jgi:hypothetical protein
LPFDRPVAVGGETVVVLLRSGHEQLGLDRMDPVIMRTRRCNDVVDVCTMKSGETVATKVDGPGSDVMEHAELAYHGSNAKDSCHFAAVRTLIGKSTGYNVYSLAPIVVRCSGLVLQEVLSKVVSLDSP